MKKVIIAIVLVILTAFTFTFAACSNNGGDNPPVLPPNEDEVEIDGNFTATGNILVVYFSKTNTTQSVALKIQELTGADIFEVERKEPYPDAYTPTTEVAKEEKDNNARPELKTYLPKEVMERYDTIFLGFPIWWHTAPMPILSFLNFYDLSGKTIYTFCTAASSPISESTADIRSNAKGANVVEGRKFSRNDSGIESWINSLNLLNQ
ncbi:MAG: flavodoxin [Clostridia bacterium]|nr:flavodoxin [Clostridia bacterium]